MHDKRIEEKKVTPGPAPARSWWRALLINTAARLGADQIAAWLQDDERVQAAAEQAREWGQLVLDFFRDLLG